jgi:hypothetical protein
VITKHVAGLRDGKYTAGTAFLLRKLRAAGAEVQLASTGRVTVVVDGKKTVYVLVFDPSVNNSPLTQALADLEAARTDPADPGKKSAAQLDREIAEALARDT